MTTDPRVESVAQALAGITKLCDSGYAVAVHIRLTRPTLLYQNYAKAWTEHYSEKGYMMLDPTVHWGLQHTGVISWTALEPKDSAGIFRDARSFGLDHGVTCSVGEASSRTIGSGTKSGTDFSESERAVLASCITAIHDATDGYEDFPPAVQKALRDLGHQG